MIGEWRVVTTHQGTDEIWNTHARVFVHGAMERNEEALIRRLTERGAQLLLAFRAEEPVARCLIGPHGGEEKGLYYAGFFASTAEGGERAKAFGVLLESAKQQMAISANGRALVAPVNCHSWFAYRLRYDDHPVTYPWEPKRDTALQLALRECGFKEHLQYWSIGSRGLNKVLAHSAPYYHAAVKRHFRFVPFTDFAGDKSHALLKLIWQISLKAFAHSPLFVPVSFEEYCQYNVRAFDAVPRDLGRLLMAPDGTAIGFMWNFFAADRSTLVFKTMALDPSYHGQRLGDALLYEPVREAITRGADEFISALVVRGNKSEFISRHGETIWEHYYSTWIWSS